MAGLDLDGLQGRCRSLSSAPAAHALDLQLSIFAQACRTYGKLTCTSVRKLNWSREKTK